MCLQYKSSGNTVGKGEIALNEQFLLFLQCFLPIRRTFCHFHKILNCCLQTLSVWKSLKFLIWERVHNPETESFWKHYGKRRNAGSQHFLLFPQCSTLSKAEIIIFATLNLSSAFALNLATSIFLYPRIKKSGAYCFTVVRLSVCTNLTWKLNIFPLLLN